MLNCLRLRDAGIEATTTGVERIQRLAQAGERARRVVERRRQQLQRLLQRLALARDRAPSVEFVLAISCVSSWLREASVFSACAPCTSRPSNAGSSRVSSAVTSLVLDSPGAK